MTECGLPYAHDTHLFRTPRGKVKTCDGVLRADKIDRKGKKQ